VATPPGPPAVLPARSATPTVAATAKPTATAVLPKTGNGGLLSTEP
jgi:hypothetical protein